jgi:uncharacterized protein with NAD-binding domain and iron-sulfur cluster
MADDDGSRSLGRKVAILGGGMASLAAAWTLAKIEPNCEITIYQLGWRLGGKGASARNRHVEDRSEEHGLHIWFGCYDNAFRILRECYAVAGAPEGAPIASVEEAFQPQDRTPIGEFVDGAWRFWPVTYPRNSGVPGTEVRASIWEHIANLITLADQAFDGWQKQAVLEETLRPRKSFTERLIDPPEVQRSGAALGQCRCLAQARRADPTRRYRRGAFWLVDSFQTWRYRWAILRRLKRFGSWSKRAVDPAAQSEELRRVWTSIDLAVTVVRGVLVDGALLCGLESIDGEDLRAWLARHGAHPTTVWSGIVRALYDLVFAYEDGETGDGTPRNPGKPNFAAGAALEVLRRIIFARSGSVAYEMQAGMGEVVFSPIYKALRKKGVTFEFFHRVKRLELTHDGKSVAKIHIGRQVKLKKKTYEPLVVVKGLECWPSEPDFMQIENGNSVRGVDLESYWNGWTDLEDVVLVAGQEFHDVILGIPLPALNEICGDLIRRKRRWRQMVRHVKTTQTQSVQLWMKPDLESLGWTRGRLPVNACPEPLDVWEDMSHMLPRESWSGPDRPLSIQYLCGPLPGDFASRPRHDTSVSAEALCLVRSAAISWLRQNGKYFWPNAIHGRDDGRFDWNVLYDPRSRRGEQRIDFQYLRANVDPTALYVLSVAGSTKYRLRPQETGCRNLFVAGDWTYTPYNAGCMEAAAISGVNAAQALAGVRAAPLALSSRLIRCLKLVARSLCRHLIAIGIVGRGALHRAALKRKR